MARQTKMLLALAVVLLVGTGSHARPYPDETDISHDPLARYEVYVPDGTGQMAQQMLTLPEIRKLLARQSDAGIDFDTAQMDSHVSLAGGKGILEQLPYGEKAPRVDVSDVVSSVKTIMASRMAELDQEQKPLYVDAQQTDDEIPVTTVDSVVDVTEAVVSDVPEDVAAVPEVSQDVATVAETPVAETVEETPVAETVEEPAETRGDHHDKHHDHHDHHHEHHDRPAAVFEPVPKGNAGLLATNQDQDRELHDLTKSSNKLAWQVWSNAIKQRSIENNEVMSPLALTSALGIAFLGARGSTAEAIDATLDLDKLSSRNPHLHLQQVARDVDVGQHFQSAQSHMVYVDEAKSQVQDIFRARVDTLYGASLTSNISEVQGMVRSGLDVRSPFSIVSSASLNVAWPSNTVPVDQEEEYLHFLNLPSSAQVATGRKLVAVPTIRTTGHFYAGYDAELDATAVAVPLHPIRDGEETNWTPSDALNQAGHLSLVMVMPGSSGAFEAGGSGLAALEQRLASKPDGWDHLLSQTKPHHLQVDLPKLGGESHMSLARALQTPAIGNLSVIFDPRKADFRGISSARPLYLSDLVQMSKLNVSSVATIADEDEIHARKTDATKRQGAQAGKQVNKPKPTKVQTTVKTPCQEAADDAVEKALAAAMEAIRKVSKTPVAKKPATPAKNQVKAHASASVQSRPAQKKPVPAKQGGAKPQNKVQAGKPAQKKPQQQKVQARPQQKKPVNKAPVKQTPVKKAPVKQTPVKTAPIKQTPVKTAPIKQTPVNKTPVRPTAAKTPAKTPAKSPAKAPVKTPAKTPAKPVNKAPVKQNPKVPAKTPAKSPAKTPTKPINKAPVKQNVKTPAKQTPNKAPVKQTPNKPPVKQTPNKAPVKQSPEGEPLLIAPAPPRPVTAKPTTKKPVQKPTTKKPAAKPTTKKPTARPNPKKPVPTTTRPKTTARPTVRNVAKTTPKVQTKTPANQKPVNKKPVTNNQTQVKKPRVERDVAQHISFNRAFLYAVRHNPTGLLLMIGRYVHPEEH